MTGGSLSEQAAALRSVAERVPSGVASDLTDEIERIRDELAAVLGDPMYEEVQWAHQVTEQATVVLRGLVAVRAKLNEVADHHQGGGSPSGTLFPRGASPTAPSPVSATGPDGSSYPPDAQDPHLLPPLKGTSRQERTRGNAKINGRPIGQLVSGNVDPTTKQRDPYVQTARRRLMACGQDPWNANHIEVKLAARMGDVRATEGEVTINNYPCGYEQSFTGCDDILERILPTGTSLTVRGTQGQQPFEKTYRGRGPAWDT